MIKKSNRKKIGTIIFLLIATALTSQSLPVLGQGTEINLIDEQHKWLPYSAAIVTQNASDLNIIVSTNFSDTLFNRAYLPMEISSDKNDSLLFALQYAALSYSGNGVFISEIRDNETDGILWSTFLNDTSGQLSSEMFELPTSLPNRPLEFRFYIWTDGPGEHILDVKKAEIRTANETHLM